MRSYFINYKGEWSFYEWCGKAYWYNPQTHMITASWLSYKIHSPEFETVECEQEINPLDVNLNTEMGQAFAKLFTFLSTYIP